MSLSGSTALLSVLPLLLVLSTWAMFMPQLVRVFRVGVGGVSASGWAAMLAGRLTLLLYGRAVGDPVQLWAASVPAAASALSLAGTLGAASRAERARTATWAGGGPFERPSSGGGAACGRRVRGECGGVVGVDGLVRAVGGARPGRRVRCGGGGEHHLAGRLARGPAHGAPSKVPSGRLSVAEGVRRRPVAREQPAEDIAVRPRGRADWCARRAGAADRSSGGRP
jgi:hypothetical protein